CSAIGDRLRQHFANRRPQRGGAVGGLAARQRRMEAREEKGLGDIDVAEPGHARLVEKERLERAIRVREERGEASRRQRAAERLDAEDLELGEHGLIAAADGRDVTEAAWIHLANPPT